MNFIIGGEGGLTWEQGTVLVAGFAGGVGVTVAAVTVVLRIYHRRLSRHYVLH